MKNRLLTLLFILTTALMMGSCEFGVQNEEPDSHGNLSINGQVVEASTGDPIDNSSIRIFFGENNANLSSDNNGKFSTTISLGSDSDVKFITSKTGYISDTMSVFASIGSDISVPLIQLKKNSNSNYSNSGKAASVYLYSQSSKSVGVKESGTNETVQIVFEVLDSSGVPISYENSEYLKFKFGANPGGGEFLYPDSIQTNALGRASVTLNTGTKAGVAQVIAEFRLEGNLVRSKPVLIAINGGFPDKNHFDVASSKLNYPAYGIVGYSISFTSYVGDKYSNPVRPNTSVYFKTSSGIIQGSGTTNDMGAATVALLTQPFPEHPIYGAGFFDVTASTIDENESEISTQTTRLLSGFPKITITPQTFDISNGGSQVFNYTVSDANGNPLSESTNISVQVVSGDLKVDGGVNINLPDTQSKNFTTFSFRAFDSRPDTVISKNATIKISTAGPNGEISLSISGISR